MQQLFDLPESYDRFLNQGIGITGNDKHYFIRGRMEMMCNHLSFGKPRRILDFGCGIGDSSLALKGLFPLAEIIGTDVSFPAIEFASKQNEGKGIQFLVYEDWEMEKGNYDLVYINCVFHHVDIGDRQQVMNRLFEKMAPQSEIWIFENNPLNPGTQAAMYFNPFDKGVKKQWPGDLKQKMKSAGFEGNKARFLFYFPEWLSWFRPLEKWGENLPLGGQYGIQGIKKAAF
jgi:ubiquinone/menaquinone biosynthesis C-methylase UbiE